MKTDAERLAIYDRWFQSQEAMAKAHHSWLRPSAKLREALGEMPPIPCPCTSCVNMREGAKRAAH